MTSDWRGRAARHDAEPVEVVARHIGMHHFDGAAGQTEGHRPQRTGTRPVHQLVHLRDDKALVLELVGDLGQNLVLDRARTQDAAS